VTAASAAVATGLSGLFYLCAFAAAIAAADTRMYAADSNCLYTY